MNFVFKEVKTTSMKAAGILDADNMIIVVLLKFFPPSYHLNTFLPASVKSPQDV